MSPFTWFVILLLGFRALGRVGDASYRRARKAAEAFVAESGAALELLDSGFGIHRWPFPNDEEWSFGWGFLFGPGGEAAPSLAVYVSPMGRMLYTETNPSPISSADTTGNAA